jgi:acetyltransferase-like isoleucine patch superfamily enzyme
MTSRAPGDLRPAESGMRDSPGHLAKTHSSVTGERSALSRYQDVVVGHRSLLGLLYYEFCMWLSPIPGALGLLLRKLFWPRLFAACGSKVYFGTNVALMHPHRIQIGDRTVVGNACVLDARADALEPLLTIGDDVMLSHNVMLSSKNGLISIGHRVGIGPYTVVQAADSSEIGIGDDAVIAAHCYVAGGGQYRFDRLDVPIARQEMRPTGATSIGAGAWLGARVTVLGGASIGRESIVGAGAVVTSELPPYSISVGVPARVVRYRGEHKVEPEEVAAL